MNLREGLVMISLIIVGLALIVAGVSLGWGASAGLILAGVAMVVLVIFVAFL